MSVLMWIGIIVGGSILAVGIAIFLYVVIWMLLMTKKKGYAEKYDEKLEKREIKREEEYEALEERREALEEDLEAIRTYKKSARTREDSIAFYKTMYRHQKVTSHYNSKTKEYFLYEYSAINDSWECEWIVGSSDIKITAKSKKGEKTHKILLSEIENAKFEHVRIGKTFMAGVGSLKIFINNPENNHKIGLGTVYNNYDSHMIVLTTMDEEIFEQAYKFIVANKGKNYNSHFIAPPFSAADEISKLSALLNSGLLSQEEFDSEKVKILSR